LCRPSFHGQHDGGGRDVFHAGGFGRILTWSLAAAGANDFLQAALAALTAKANEVEERAAR